MTEFTTREAVVICESMLWNYHRGILPSGLPEYLQIPTNTPILHNVVGRAMQRGELDRKWDVDGEAILDKIAQLDDTQAAKMAGKAAKFLSKAVSAIQYATGDPLSPEEISDDRLRLLLQVAEFPFVFTHEHIDPLRQ